MAVFVIKADGSRQLFDREKIIRTSIRMGVSRTEAENIANEVEAKIYEGIETKKVLKIVFKLLEKYRPAIKNRIDLRKALSLLKSKPDFEQFIQILLSEHGYKVTPNRIIRGKCVEHEVDAIARKNGRSYIVEVKHHFNYHTPTGLDESRISRAVFEDITEGFELGLNKFKIDKAMIVCNTKLSAHSEKYARCRGIDHICWSHPKESDLQTMVEKKKLYPATYCKGMNREDRDKLSSAGIILLRQIIDMSPEEIRRKTRINKDKINKLRERAKTIYYDSR